MRERKHVFKKARPGAGGSGSSSKEHKAGSSREHKASAGGRGSQAQGGSKQQQKGKLSFAEDEEEDG